MCAKYQLPKVKVISVEEKGEVSVVRIEISSNIDYFSYPTAPSDLRISEPFQRIWEFHRLIAREDNKLAFETYERQLAPPKIGQTYDFCSWWRKDQLLLAQSNPEDFRLYRFTPKSPEDHDHCKFCWKHICNEEHGDHEAYINGQDSVCFECFDKYIASGFGKKLGDAT
jgi:hypothetical protein